MDGHMKRIANGIIGAYEWASKNETVLNGIDAERAVRAATTSVIEALAEKMEAGGADDNAYEAVLALMLAHDMVKKCIARNDANSYRFSVAGGFESNVKNKEV